MLADKTQSSVNCKDKIPLVEEKMKKHRCVFCDYRYDKASALKVHVESVHEGKMLGYP